MSVPKKEKKLLNQFLKELKKVFPIESSEINELRAQKGTSLKQPTLGVCSIKLDDELIGALELRYFPSTWNWGKKQGSLRNKIYLQNVTLRKPISSLTKAPFFGGAGLYSIEGKEEIKEKTGFIKSEVVGYKFKSLGRNKENKEIVEKINSDRDLIEALNKEFSIARGRPLPDLSIEGKLIPLGGFDIFNVDDEEGKITENNFWSVDDPESPNKLVKRYEVLKKLAKSLSQ